METTDMGKLIWLANLAATLWMTGLIWFVQIVHYPLFARVGAAGYVEYQLAHQTLTTYVVLPPMVIELATAGLLLAVRPAPVPGWAVWLGLVLVLLIWGSTFFLQVPRHELLNAGFQARAHSELVSTNWLRTLAWSARSLLCLALTVKLLK